ncbi:MAG: hypothetical protein JWN04_470 [Myxococcaceae bacterium]|nr:hypothetical protein [Myxococcaceae bacterium]
MVLGTRSGVRSKYAWEASNSAPAGGVMEIVGGDLLSGDDGSQYVPRGPIGGGWGQPMASHVSGEEKKPVPDALTVTFFSYLEDKFYRGAFPLPRERIAQLFAEGFPHKYGKGGRKTYDSIIVGVAPGGAVAVWLSGSRRQLEVLYGHADEVSLDWHRALDMPPQVDRQKYVADSLAHAAKKDPLVAPSMQRVPIGLWDSYRERFAWTPVFEGIPAPESVGRVSFFNGEHDEIWLPLSDADRRATRAVPKYVSFGVESLNRIFDVTFDEAEVFSVFRRLGASGEPVELVFAQKQIEGKSSFGVFVRNQHETVGLTKNKYAFFAKH